MSSISDSTYNFTNIPPTQRSKTSIFIHELIKGLAIITPIVLILFIVYSNFIASHNFNYFLDIGNPLDSKKSYLTPISRISNIENSSDESSRSIISGLVYFDSPIPRGSDNISVSIKFKDNFPEGASLTLGAKNGAGWNYLYKQVYYQVLNNLSDFDKGNNESIYRINKYLPLINSLSEIPNGSVISTNLKIQPIPSDNKYEIKPLKINTSLRGGHTFYIYLKDSLYLNASKQDLNWYNGEDNLTITLLDPYGNVLANSSIPDDGIVSIKQGSSTIQTGGLIATNLSSGVYVLTFSEFDGIIREISLNTNKIVSNKLFLADWNGYLNSEKPSNIYIKTDHLSKIYISTYHASSFQNVLVNGQNISINSTSKPSVFTAMPGEYYIKSKTNDIIISSVSPISFSNESSFQPFRYSIIQIPSSLSQLKEQADYLITDYKPTTIQGESIIINSEFNLNELYVTNGKLNILINMPHLSVNSTQNYTIPIDWINITVHKNGAF